MKLWTILLVVSSTLACTNYLVSKSASADSSTFISYAADSHTLYGELKHLPAANHTLPAKVKVYDWDTGKYLGEIDQVAQTYNVIGNMNEYQVSIGETTYGGLAQLTNTSTNATIDYGTLIWTTLQRAKTAREAIHTMGDLVKMYGYASEGESFSVADPNEAWILEMIGKGAYGKGAVWVARKVPDGYICAHANQARIRTFPLNDTENCIYSDDVITFAQDIGLYPKDAAPEKFSFSDTYDPVNFEGARFCETRVWSFFRHCGAPGLDAYLEYVKGVDLKNRMPLFVKPAQPVSLNDTMNYMRDHFEGTWFEFDQDIGAGAYNLPYRWRPLTWTVKDKTYLNERSVGTQQTGWTFVSQMRSWLPREIGGLIWFGVDDTAGAVYTPFYASMTRVPKTWAEGNGGMMNFTFESAFWVFNMVNNYAYTRYNVIHPEVFEKIVSYENQYFMDTAEKEKDALTLYKTDKEAAIELLTAYSCKTGDDLTADWLEFWKALFVKYMDGNTKYPAVAPSLVPVVEWPGYGQKTYDRIVAETGDHYLDGVPAKKFEMKWWMWALIAVAAVSIIGLIAWLMMRSSEVKDSENGRPLLANDQEGVVVGAKQAELSGTAEKV